jgi:hypothetical protein
MSSGRQSYPALNQSTVGYRVLNPQPLDVYLGPWESVGSGNTAGTTSGGVSLANSIISPGVRYQGLQVIIIANSDPGQPGGQTLSYKYWYSGGTNDSDLVEFSAGGGAAFDSSQSYNWTAPQYFSSGFSAAGGITFDSAPIFVSGLSASGATLGRLIVNSGSTLSGRVDVDGVLDVVGGATFENTSDFVGIARFSGGISAAGATLASLVVNTGITLQGGASSIVLEGVGASIVLEGVGATIVGPFGSLNPALAASPSTIDRLNVPSGLCAAGGITFNGPVSAPVGISAAGATLGQLFVFGGATFARLSSVDVFSAYSGISANGGATFDDNVYVGGTLSVDGNFYVAGTLTTVNESQLLIQDKYLVLGSTLSSGEFAVGAGVYIGSTTSPIASFAYNDTGVQRWVSNKPIYVNNDLVVTSGNISAQTGITAEQSKIEHTSANSVFQIPFMFPMLGTESVNRILYSETNTGTEMLYNPSTNVFSVYQVEAIIDGGTWGVP